MTRVPRACMVCGETDHNAATCKDRAPERETLSCMAAAIRDLGITEEEWNAAPTVPETRAQCIDGPRPCVFLRCRHRLAPTTYGACSLDVSGEGDHTLTVVGRVLGVTRERVRQIEAAAVSKLRRRHGVSLPVLR